jgi:purine-binding chemotaxis protein CheW
VLLDTVREVLRVPRDLVDAVPAFLARRGEVTEVESVCRLDDGRRLVSVLSAERLFKGSDLRAALDAHRGDAEAEMDDTRTGADEAGDEDEQLVVFRLDGEEYCVRVDAVQEIIRVPEELISVPRASHFVEGLVNLRGGVLPVVDLRTRLGLERVERNDLHRIVVLVVDGVRTGFIVDSVQEVLKLAAASVEQAPELSEEQARIVSQVANLTDAKRMLLILDAANLLVHEDLARLPQAA